MAKLINFVNNESGAAAAEYAMILALVFIVIIAGMTTLGISINTALANPVIATTLSS